MGKTLTTRLNVANCCLEKGPIGGRCLIGAWEKETGFPYVRTKAKLNVLFTERKIMGPHLSERNERIAYTNAAVDKSSTQLGEKPSLALGGNRESKCAESEGS